MNMCSGKPLNETACAVSFGKPGDIIIRQGDTTDWQNVIVRADPIACFSDEILLTVLRGEIGWPECVLTLVPPSCDMPDCRKNARCWACVCLCTGATHSAVQCFTNWKVIVTGANATYLYIIKGYDMERHCWIGAWPD